MRKKMKLLLITAQIPWGRGETLFIIKVRKDEIYYKELSEEGYLRIQTEFDIKKKCKNPIRINSNKFMKYLVTGGAGFIGSNIVKKLLGLGCFVRVVDNLSTGRKENIQEFLENRNFGFIEGDISNLETARLVVKDIDFILHQAAIPSVARSIADPLATNRANINGTLNILLAAKENRVKKIVYASSSSIYGDSLKLPKEESFSPNPISPYSLTKYIGEKYCELFYKIYGLPTISLRYFNVFGPNQDPNSEYSAVLPKFIKAILNNKSPIIYGDGEQSRDFTYVENVVEANLLAVHSKTNGEMINIACGKRYSLNQIISLINKILGKNIKPIYQSLRPGDIKHSLASIAKANKLLDYKPIIPFVVGLEKTIEWYKNHD